MGTEEDVADGSNGTDSDAIGEPLPNETTSAPWIQAAIRAGRPYHYGKKVPLRHNAINLGIVGALLGVLVLLFRAHALASAWVYVPLAALGFGWVYFAFFVLVVHEASHDMFVVSRNRALARRVNRIAGWLVAGVFGTHYGNHWERGHVQHHVRPLEPDDPQRYNILVGKRLLALAIANLAVPGFIFVERTLLRTRKPGGKSTSTKGVIVAFALFWIALLTITVRTVGWAPALAMYFGLHVAAVLNQIKGGLEHGGAIGEEKDPFLRSRTTRFLLRPIVMPFNISLHFEHHLNFQVPWYDLGRYSRDLRVIVPPEVQHDVINHRVVAQLLGRVGGMSEEARAASVSTSG